MFKYFPHNQEDIQAMLDKIGIEKIEDLFNQIDPKLIITDINIPSSFSEMEIRKEFKRLANNNKNYVSFLGAGSYDVIDFAAINALTSRQEFLTSYTPYQPEISQGTLQYIFEYQSMICELTGMDVTNASMYDGATATAEAMFMAVSQSKKNKVLISKTVNNNTREVVKTYAKYRGIEVLEIEEKDYVTDINSFKNLIDENVGSVILSNPNFYGVIEDYKEFNEVIKENSMIFIMNSDPSTLSVLKSPREWGADIACGEAQSLGIPLSFGGPYLGYLATTNKLVRKMPGRICGITNDVDGKRAFVLTLQAREQHIRREKANSNICSNQSLMALHVAIYTSLLGKKGLVEISKLAYNNTHYLYEELLKTKHFKKETNNPFYKEFVIKFNGDINKFEEYMRENNILPGLILKDNCLLVCATEARTKDEIDNYIRLVGEYNVR
ncbi:MAG: aminomethyl-transferring glycine dehydrogenase subunit GcvPA [Bacilli bacterium]